MARRNKEAELALPFRPVDPLPPSDSTKWKRIAKDTYALGSKATVGEKTGSKEPTAQKWEWRVIAFDGQRGRGKDRDAAMRAAEFALGLGEMEVVS